MFQVLHPNSWDEACKLATRLGDAWVFRGQADPSWRLETTLERAARFWYWYFEKEEREQSFLWQFRSQAHLYQPILPREECLLDWLSLLQHFGGPTRLLDFTYSFYVATYFALERARSDVVVWAINTHVIDDDLQDDIAGKRLPSDFVGYSKMRIGVAEAALRQTGEPKIGVVHLVPAWFNQRISVQQGCFLFPLSLKHSFEANLVKSLSPNHEMFKARWTEAESSTFETWKPDPAVSAIKIILPTRAANVRNEIWGDLRRMNVTTVSLFPDLGGLARSFHLSMSEPTYPISQAAAN
ncbi:FRG domain-containing protein [Paraburkholderia caribensis]|uniref:FRG domain-containing protein n=1 Tax=Paraburkholderia caribensis TaxID=75105 RepID=UPI0034D16CA0